MRMDERHVAAVKKHAADTLRGLGVKHADEFEPHKLAWRDLNGVAADLKRTARGLRDQLTDKTPEAEAKSLEEAHEGLMAMLDECDGERDARNAVGSLEPRAHGGSPKRPHYPDVIARPDGGRMDGSAEERAAFALRPEQRMVDWAAKQARGERHDGLTDGQFLRAMVLGAHTDAERRALAEGSDSAGGYTVPDVLSASLIDRLRAASVVMRAGARTVPLTSDVNYIARVETDPVPAWRLEAGAVAESGPTFGRVTLTPRSLAVLVTASREVLEDSLNIEATLPQIIASAMAVEVDRVALFGSGVAPEPRGVVNIAGINSVALGGALTNYSKLVQARTEVLTSNAPGLTAYVMHPRDEGKLAGLVDSTGQPLAAPKVVEAVPFLTTTSVPGLDDSPAATQIVTGYFPHMLVGVRSSLRIEVLKERYADTLQVGFLAHLRMDVAVEHATSFCTITGITG